MSRVERGRLDGLPLRSIRAIAAALEVTVELLPRSRAASLERIANQAHAALAEQVVAWLSGLGGWVVRPEVSFSRFGERGVIDLLAWHAASRSLLVIELKTEIVDVGELLGTFDRKLRNAHEIAAGLGWDVVTVSRLLVIGEGAYNRRRVGSFAATFAAALPDRSARVRRWLVNPSGSVRGLIYFSNRHPGQPNARITTVRRVRRPRGAPALRTRAGHEAGGTETACRPGGVRR